MVNFEILQTVSALMGLTAFMYLSYRLKRTLKGYARTRSYR